MPDLVDPNAVFTPGSPVNTVDFFLGRSSQIRRIQDAIPSPGRHPVVFGQRGVGKTSLVNILPWLLSKSEMVVRVTCVESDTFKAIWSRALGRTALAFDRPPVLFQQQATEEQSSLADFLPPATVCTRRTWLLLWNTPAV